MSLLNLTTTRPQDNAHKALSTLLQRLRIRVTALTVRETLPQHPDYPSLLSLSNMLDEWQVDNTALRLGNVEQLRELPTPFIAHLTRQNGWFVVVEQVEKGQITWYNPTDGQHTASLDDFGKQWNGVVLLAEATDKSGEIEFTKQRKRERLQTARTGLLITGAIALLALGFYQADSLLTVGLLLTKLLGTMVSILLLIRQFDNQNPLLNRLCKLGSKANCQSILDSSAARLTPWLSWSEIGFFYFAGGLLFLYTPEFHSGQRLPILALLNLLALPYTLFSIYYQWRIAKQWCVLCLIVQGVLWVEFGLTLSGMSNLGLNNLGFDIRNSLKLLPFTTLGSFLFAYGLPMLLYVLLKPSITKALQNNQYQQQLNRLKYNPDIFQTLLEKQPKAPNWLPEKVVTLGNPDAEHTLIMVTNPFCGPCGQMHKEIDKLLHQNRHLKAHIIFTACDGPDGPTAQVVKYLLTLGEAEKIAMALDAWYEQPSKNYEVWATLFSLEADMDHLNNTVQQHCQWQQEADIMATPTLFLNGYRLPEQYRLAELRFIINGLYKAVATV